MINDPVGLRGSNEKLLALEVEGAAAPSIVSADPRVVAEFVREHEVVVVKPLNEFSGHGIVRYSTRDSDLDAESVGLVTHEGGTCSCSACPKSRPATSACWLSRASLSGGSIGCPRRVIRVNIHQGARVEADHADLSRARADRGFPSGGGGRDSTWRASTSSAVSSPRST